MAEPEDRGRWLSIATALFFSWALFACCIRTWVTLGRKQRWAYADSGVVSAVAMAVLHVASNFSAVSNGYGRQIAEIGDEGMKTVEKALFISQISYIGCTGITRISAAFFIGQLTRHAPHIRMSYIVAGIAGGWTVASLIPIALRGNLSEPWKVLDGSQTLFHRWLAVEITGLVLEIALWSLSLSLIWGLQMKLQKRILILGAFGCRLLLIPLIAARLAYLSPAKNHDPTVSNIQQHILTEAAMNYALTCMCVTSLKPFFKPFHTGAVVNTVGGGMSDTYPASHSKGPSQGIYMLSSLSRETEQETTGQSESEGREAPRKKFTGRKMWNLSIPTYSKEKSVNCPGQGQLVIQKTTEWDVSSQEHLTSQHQ